MTAGERATRRREKRRRYWVEHPEKRRRLRKRYRAAHPEKWIYYEMRYRAKLRAEALAAYSEGRPACKWCGSKEALQIDHVNGGGSDHRRQVSGGKASWHFYLWLRRNGWPDGFQVLCSDCNHKKATLIDRKRNVA